MKSELDADFVEKLLRVQSAIKVGKTHRNNFGEYYYRSLEDIFAALRPLAVKEGLLFYVTYTLASEDGDTDEGADGKIVDSGRRFYIVANAICTDGKNAISASAYARETRTKKKTASEQRTGGAQSYAAKYALCNLLLIADDEFSDEDPDKRESGDAPTTAKPAAPRSPFETAAAELLAAPTREAGIVVWKKYRNFAGNKVFDEAVAAMNVKFKKG